MTQLKIALDVDGVLADVIESWIILNNKTRPIIKKNNITEWDFWKNHKIDRFDFYSELSTCWKNWECIPPTEINLSRITEGLGEFGQVDIVTARERTTDSFVQNWLDRFKIKFDNYVSVIHGPAKAELDYDVFIDDSPLNATSIQKNNKKILLYNQPWNAKIQGKNIFRIYSLSEAIKNLTNHKN